MVKKLPVVKEEYSWTMLGPRLDDPSDWEDEKNILKWGVIPSRLKSKIQSLALLVDEREIKELPECVGSLKNLVDLNFPMRFARNLKPNSIPDSVQLLYLSEGFAKSVTWPKGLIMPNVLGLASGPLKFRREHFPNLVSLGLKLDSKASMVDVVAEYESLEELQLLNVKSNDIFARVSHLPLRQFGISGGTLKNLKGIERLKGIKELEIAVLRKLESIAGLEKLTTVQSLCILYCKHIKDIERVLKLRSLKRLDICMCDDIGLSRIEGKLEKMNIKKMDTVGTN